MLGISLRLGWRAGGGTSAPSFTPAALFAAGEQGAWYDPSDLSTMFQGAEGTTPVTAGGQPVGGILDKSGRGNHATQATAAARPLYQTEPDRLVIDKVDDRLIVSLPAITGTMVLATPEGTAAYGVNIGAGNYDIGGIGGQYFPGTAIVGQIIRDGAMTPSEIDDTIAYFRDEKGAGNNYGAVTNFSSAWRNYSSLTSFPLIDTSSGTIFSSAWFNCSSLTSFPANFFDTCAATSYASAFTNTALDQTSIDGILVSIESNGTSNGTFDQSGGSAPSAMGETAIDALRARGWAVTVTGGY